MTSRNLQYIVGNNIVVKLNQEVLGTIKGVFLNEYGEEIPHTRVAKFKTSLYNEYGFPTEVFLCYQDWLTRNDLTTEMYHFRVQSERFVGLRIEHHGRQIMLNGGLGLTVKLPLQYLDEYTLQECYLLLKLRLFGVIHHLQPNLFFYDVDGIATSPCLPDITITDEVLTVGALCSLLSDPRDASVIQDCFINAYRSKGGFKAGWKAASEAYFKHMPATSYFDAAHSTTKNLEMMVEKAESGEEIDNFDKGIIAFDTTLKSLLKKNLLKKKGNSDEQ